MSTPVATLPANVSRETYAKLQAYEALLVKWQKSINLVSSRQQELWQRHILDSLQLTGFMPSDKEAEVYDLGSGGGLPGIVLAIALPSHRLTLVESDSRKCVFLSEICRKLELRNVVICNCRIEALPPEAKADIVVSRALAPLKELLAYSQPLLKKGAFCLFLKGRNWANEITQARQLWEFALQESASITEAEARVLIIQQLTRISESKETRQA